MAKDALELKRTVAVLEQYAETWAKAYKAELISTGKRATGELINSIRPEVVIKGDVYSAVLNIADYYKYVEWGRKRGSKMPPVSAILKWVKVKPVVPHQNTLSGRVPTQEQLAWAIAKGIQKNGIEPTPALRDSNEMTFNTFESKLRQALTEDLGEAAYILVSQVVELK